MIDSGATNNYIRTNFKELFLRLKQNGITINLLNNDLVFFENDELKDFDMALGDQGLRKKLKSISLNIKYHIIKVVLKCN